jgi:hypothetical protein
VIRPEQLAGPDPDPQDWYANLLVLNGRKCLLLARAESLFTIFEPDVRAAQLRATHQLVTQLIERELGSEGLPLSTFGHLEDESLSIAKTADRRVLGCMNDMALHCEYSVEDAGSLAMLDLRSLNHHLHRNINSSRGYKRPVDCLIERTTGQAWSNTRAERILAPHRGVSGPLIHPTGRRLCHLGTDATPTAAVGAEISASRGS